MPSTGRVSLVIWLITAMLAGAVLMSLELVAFRLYAPYFGYSIYVWGSMISTVMAALAAGYSLGGRLADRCEASAPLYITLFFSAAYQLFILCTVHIALPAFARYGEFIGVVVATVVVFAPSMTALAAIGPMVIQLCSRARTVGSAAGQVYAVSTMGSMAGILATSYLLLPDYGTHATLKLLCGISFLLAATGTLVWRPAAYALIPVLLLWSLPDLGWSRGAIWTAESAYNLVRVVRRGNELLLQLNKSASVHTIHAATGTWTGAYYDTYAMGPLLTNARRMLVLGMGGGASIHSTRITAPRVEIDAVEIDPKVVEAAARWFQINRTDPLLHIHVADARPWLTENHTTYDLVEVDLYHGGPYIPFYLATEEFFRLVSGHMEKNGVLMMNAFDAGPDHKLLFAMTATLKRVFPSVMVVPAQSANYMLIAFRNPRSIAAVRASVAALAQPLGRSPDVDEVTPPSGTIWFSDDHAPIEEMTRRMLAWTGS